MAFKMKGSAFKLGNVATKSALKQTSPVKDMKWWDTGEDGTPAQHEHNNKHTSGDDSEHESAPAKMKSPLEHKVAYGPEGKIRKHHHVDKKGKKMTEEEVNKANPSQSMKNHNPRFTREKRKAGMKSPLEQGLRSPYDPKSGLTREQWSKREDERSKQGIENVKRMRERAKDFKKKDTEKDTEKSPNEMKSPLEQGVNTEKMAQRSRESTEGFLKKNLTKGLKSIDNYFNPKKVNRTKEYNRLFNAEIGQEGVDYPKKVKKAKKPIKGTASSAYRKAKMMGKSPAKQGKTSFIDKVKSAASAVGSSLGKVNPVGYPLTEAISDKYSENKKKYRADKQNKMKSGAKPAKKKSPAKQVYSDYNTNTDGDSSLLHDPTIGLDYALEKAKQKPHINAKKLTKKQKGLAESKRLVKKFSQPRKFKKLGAAKAKDALDNLDKWYD